MARNLPKRHQRSIVPQKRSTTGRFKPKAAGRQQAIRGSIGRPQAIPTMLTARNGAIGEM